MSWYIMNNLIRLIHSVGDEEVTRAKVSLKAVRNWTVLIELYMYDDPGRIVFTHYIETTTTDDMKGIHELPDYTWFRRHSYWLRY